MSAAYKSALYLATTDRSVFKDCEIIKTVIQWKVQDTIS